VDSVAEQDAMTESTLLSDEGIGEWQSVNESMSTRAANFQERITGHPASESYIANGVRFDGEVDNGSELIDAKGPGYDTFVDKKTGDVVDWFWGRQNVGFASGKSATSGARNSDNVVCCGAACARSDE
jgi:hypothetical protein